MSNVCRAVLAIVLMAMSGAATAQSYPSKPIRMVVSYGPGGTADILGRLVAQHLAEALKQPVVVENRPGANGQLGHDAVAKAAPDGYTLAMGNSTVLAVSVSLYQSMPFDPKRDFAPVSAVAAGPLVLVTNATLPVKSVKDLVAYAKEQPGKLSVGLPGVGSMHHLVTEMLKLDGGVEWVNVPYRGAQPMIIDLLGGRVDFGIDNIPTSLEHIRSGKFRALAVTSRQRTSLLPDVPTMSEAGMPGVEAESWHGVLAPAGTAPAIIDRLHGEIVRYLRQAATVERLASLGLDVVASSPQEFQQLILSENVKWAKIAKASGAKLE